MFENFLWIVGLVALVAGGYFALMWKLDRRATAKAAAEFRAERARTAQAREVAREAEALRPVFGAAAILRAAYATGDPRGYLEARLADPEETRRYEEWRATTRLRCSNRINLNPLQQR